MTDQGYLCVVSVAKKETVVKGWPGGVRAAVEVIQGSLRDIGVEVRFPFFYLYHLATGVHHLTQERFA